MKKVLLLLTFVFVTTGFALAAQEYSADHIVIETYSDIMSLPEGTHKAEPEKLLIKSASISTLNTKHKVKKVEKLFREVKTKPGFVRMDKTTVQVPDLSNFHVVHFPEGSDVKAIVEEYKKDPGIKSASLDYKKNLFLVPNDPKFKDYPESENQWGLFRIGAPQAWDITTGSEYVVIAVIDTGVNSNHEDLQGKIIGGYNFTNFTTDTSDGLGHGSHVAGIIAASTNNSKGIAGITWNCKIMPLKMFDDSGLGFTISSARAIIFAADNGAKVINMSYGGLERTPYEENAVNYAYARGCVMVAAAGNLANGTPHYPAAYEHVIAVAATDVSDRKADYSSFGPWVDICAPGGDTSDDPKSRILSTYKQNNYVWMMGTSMAAPHVAGVVALLRSVRIEMTPDAIEEWIKTTADYVDPYYYEKGLLGAGRINAYNIFSMMPPPPEQRPFISDFDIDGKGNIYVIYNKENKIIKYDNKGNVAGIISSFKDTSLYAPMGIAVSPSGERICVADTFSNRILLYDNNLNPLSKIHDESVYAEFTVERYHDSILFGLIRSEAKFKTTRIPVPSERLKHPIDVTFIDDSTVLIVDQYNKRVLKQNISNDGVFDASQFDRILSEQELMNIHEGLMMAFTGSAAAILSQLIGATALTPVGLAALIVSPFINSHQTEWVRTHNNSIGFYNLDTFTTLESICYDGNIIVSDSGQKSIKVFKGGGEYISEYNKSLTLPKGVCVGPGGYIYVADTSNQRIQSIDSNLNYAYTIGGVNITPAPLNIKYVEKNGRKRLYYCDATKSAVQFIDIMPPSDFWLSMSTAEAYYVNKDGIKATWTSTHESDPIKIQKYQVYGEYADMGWILLKDDISASSTTSIVTFPVEGIVQVKARAVNAVGYRDTDGESSSGDPGDGARNARVVVDFSSPAVYDLFMSSKYYSPPVQGSFEATFTVMDSASNELNGLEASIFKTDGNVFVEKFIKQWPSACGKYDINWDGRDYKGVPVPDGKYIILIDAYDKAGNDVRTIKEFYVDTTPPHIQYIVLSSNLITPNNDGRNDFIDFRYKVLDTAPEVTIQLRIKTLGGASVRTYSSTGSPGYYFERWDGKDELGNIVPDGEYKYSITAVDNAGNESDPVEGSIISIINPTIMVDANPKVFSPNNDGVSDFTTISYIINYHGGLLSGESQVEFDIYNQGGIKVYHFGDTKLEGNYAHLWNGQNNQIGGGTVPDGIYKMNVYSKDPSGTIYRYQGSLMVDTSGPAISGITMEAGGEYRPYFNPYVDGGVTVEFTVDDDSLYFPTPGELYLTAEVWLNSTKIKTLISNNTISGGLNSVIWTGHNDYDDYVNEGDYQIKLSVADSTNNSTIATDQMVIRDDQRLTTTSIAAKNPNGESTNPVLTMSLPNNLSVRFTSGWDSDEIRGCHVDSGSVWNGSIYSNNWFYVNFDGSPTILTKGNNGGGSHASDIYKVSAYGDMDSSQHLPWISPVDLDKGWYRIRAWVSTSILDGYASTWTHADYSYRRFNSLIVGCDTGDIGNWSNSGSGTIETNPLDGPFGTREASYGSTIHKVFTQEADGYINLYYLRSTNGGSSWSTPWKLTHASNVSNPTITCEASGNAYVAWEDDRNGNKEIYFQKVPSNFAPVTSPGYTTMAVPQVMGAGFIIMSGSVSPELISPIDGETVQTLRPQFKWYGLTGILTYKVKSTQDNFLHSRDLLKKFSSSEVSGSKPALSYSIHEFDEGLSRGDWEWKVVADPTGAANESAVGSFTIDPPLGISGVTNWPNPFDPKKERTKIRYRLSNYADRVTIKIYDITGSLVRELDGTTDAEGPSILDKYNDVEWDGRNGRGDMVLNGVYPFEITVTSGGRSVRGRGKIVVLK